MKIEFDITPDATGQGRIVYKRKHYGLPVEVVKHLRFLHFWFGRAVGLA